MTVGLGLAFVFGMIASRLKLSPLVGYRSRRASSPTPISPQNWPNLASSC
jgi:hypothetical protein